MGEVVEVGSVGAVFKTPAASVHARAVGGWSSARKCCSTRPSWHGVVPSAAAGKRCRRARTAVPRALTRRTTLVLDDLRVNFKVRTSSFGKHRTLVAVDGVSLEVGGRRGTWRRR